jgi:hypothetical protein
MSMKTSSIVTISRPGRRTRTPRLDQRGPDPAPVVIVRAACAAATPLTPIQRARRATARQLAATVTDAAHHGWPEPYDLAVDLRVAEVPQAAIVLREAPAILADPPTGAVEVGRDGRGRPAAVVVHGDTWSLVIRPAGDPSQPAASSAFFDDWRTDSRSGCGEHLELCFDSDPSAAGAEWSLMIAAILAATS